MSSAAIAREAHEGYVAAINSNNLDSLLAILTEDVVYQSPNAPEVVGKAAVREWGKGYLDAYTIHWEQQATCRCRRTRWPSAPARLGRDDRRDGPYIGPASRSQRTLP